MLDKTTNWYNLRGDTLKPLVKRSVNVTLDKTTYIATFKAACANKYLRYIKAVPYHCKRQNTGEKFYLSYSIRVFSVTKILISGKANDKRARSPTAEKPQAEQRGQCIGFFRRNFLRWFASRSRHEAKKHKTTRSKPGIKIKTVQKYGKTTSSSGRLTSTNSPIKATESQQLQTLNG